MASYYCYLLKYLVKYKYISIYLSIKLDLGLKNLIVFRVLKTPNNKCIKEEESRRVLVTTPTSTDIKHIKLVQPSHFYLIKPAS